MERENEECIICMDEMNMDLQKIKCEKCEFKCCKKCYEMLDKVECPMCKQKFYNVNLLYKTIDNFKNRYEELSMIINMLHDRLQIQQTDNIVLRDTNILYKLKFKIMSYLFGFSTCSFITYIIWINVR